MNKSVLSLTFACLISCVFSPVFAQVVTNDPPAYGPYNGVFLPDGEGLNKKLGENDTVLLADSPWTLYFWEQPSEEIARPTLIAGVGAVEEEYPRYLEVASGKLILWMGKKNSLEASTTLALGKWHLLAAAFDGRQFHLYSDGIEVASGALVLGSVSPVLGMAPSALPAPEWAHFGGRIAGLTLVRESLSSDAIAQIHRNGNDVSLVEFEEGSKSWPVQTRGQAGYRAPQNPADMPRSKAPFSAPVASRLPQTREGLQPDGDNQWIVNSWALSEAPKVQADGEEISGVGLQCEKLVSGDGAGNGFDDACRPRCVSRSRLRPQQSGDPRKPE